MSLSLSLVMAVTESIAADLVAEMSGNSLAQIGVAS